MSGQLATPGWAGERARNQKIAIVLRDSLGASRGVLAQAFVELDHECLLDGGA
jgi:hypothetical protein